MPSPPIILCVEDEPGVLDAIVRDLAPLEDRFRVEAAESADLARPLVRGWLAAGHALALALCDHRMPGTSGTDFLIELNRDPATRATRKILLTAQAGHEDTIRAVNRADLDHYVAKPWRAEELRAVVKKHLTDYVLEAGLDPLPYLAVLDTPRLTAAIARGQLATDG
jgi:two-component system phosphate regulon response regulator PhoB